MVIRFLRGALRLHPLHLGLIALSAAMGASIAASLGAVSLQINGRIAAEMRSFGANIVVEPAVPIAPAGATAERGYLDETEIPSILTIFWRNNIVGFAPSLTAPVEVEGRGAGERALLAGVWFDRLVQRPGSGERLRAGVLPLFPYWRLEGRWPAPRERAGAVLGRALARRLRLHAGDTFRLKDGKNILELKVAGVLSTGAFEEDQVMVNIETAQEFLGLPGRVSTLLVSAVTVPLDEFGRSDPAKMTRLEFEKWFCTSYVTSVARQIEQAMPSGRARPLWSMAEAEARVLSRLNVLMLLLAGIALAAAMLAVASTFTARIMGRRAEMALMYACGAGAGHVVVFLGVEMALIGLVGGLAGAGLSALMIRGLGLAVFGAPLAVTPAVFPLAMVSALLVAAAGAVWPLYRAFRADPVAALREVA